MSRGCPDNRYPLNGIFELDQAQALASIGHKVVLAAVDLRSIRRRRSWGIKRELRNGVHVYEINIPVGRVPQGMYDLIGKLAGDYLFRIIEKEQGQPDIIHAHFLKMGVTAKHISKKRGVPFVITEHSSKWIKEPVSTKMIKQGKEVFSSASKVITVSDSLRKQIFNKTGIKTTVIHNIVSIGPYVEKTRSYGEKFRYISAGSLIYQKGFDILIEAFSMLLNEYPDSELIIMGGGIKERELKEQAERLGCADKISFSGVYLRNEFFDKAKNAQAFVLASRGETFGVVYIEALSCGLPVIATRCGGPESFIDESNGVLVDIDNPEMLAKAMIDIRNNYSDYSLNEISKKTREKFSPEKIARELTNIYDNI